MYEQGIKIFVTGSIKLLGSEISSSLTEGTNLLNCLRFIFEFLRFIGTNCDRNICTKSKAS